MSSPVQPRDVVIVGGGIAGIEALMALADLGDNRLRLHLIAERPSFSLPPESLGIPWGGTLMHVGLEALCHAFGARVTQARVTGVDAVARQVFTAGGDAVDYEHLLLAPGAQPQITYPGTRTLGFGELPAELSAETGGSLAILVPVGASWTLPAYQLGLLAAGKGRDVRVLTYEHAPLSVFGTGAEAALAALLALHGVRVEAGRTPDPRAPVDALADTVIALPVLAGPGLTGLPHDPHGFLRVDARAGVLDVAHVHAAGDATDRTIKQGGLAAQQADVAACEIARSCGGDPPQEPSAPVLRGRLTARDGEELYLQRALNGLDAGRSSRDPLWRPPSQICAWRLARWLDYHRNELEPYRLEPVG